MIRWGITGTGTIANAFAKGLKEAGNAQLVAVASRNQQRSDAFGKTYGLTQCYGTYEDLYAAADVDAIYIATPHPMHRDNAIAALNAGKHVLVEKPIGLSQAEAMEIFAVAKDKGLFAMEAFMYRCHPQTTKLLELIRDGVIGDISLVQSSFGYCTDINPDHRLFSDALGGGAILDVGCYPLSAARAIAAAATGVPVCEPASLKATGRIGETGIDEIAHALLEFENGMLAEISTAIRADLGQTLKVFGSEGAIEVVSPWLVDSQTPGAAKIIVSPSKEAPYEIDTSAPKSLYALEAEVASAAIERGDGQAAPMTWADTLGNMKALDLWRSEIGLTYSSERPENLRPSVRLTSSKDTGSAKPPMSRLVMGCDNQTTMPHARAIFDRFFDKGGNTFDTAHLYGDGIMEKLLGQWLRVNDLRQHCYLIAKGAHTPWCTPDHVEPQLLESLDRLQTDYVDVYFLHRDNLDVPIDEWLDVLDAQRSAGRIRRFGGSNWSLERCQELQAAADKKGVTGFTALSNQFSLAQMLSPLWPGCISSNTPAFKDWLKKSNVDLFPWSSQARGFFVEHLIPGLLFGEDERRSFYSPENFKRREAATKLAEKYAVQPVEIALAYVLAQDFGAFPLIGPRTLEEMDSSFTAQDLRLTPEDIKTLNQVA